MHGGATRCAAPAHRRARLRGEVVAADRGEGRRSRTAAAELVRARAPRSALGRHHDLRARAARCATSRPHRGHQLGAGRRGCCTESARRRPDRRADRRRPHAVGRAGRPGRRRRAARAPRRPALPRRARDRRASAGLTTPNLVEAETNRALVGAHGGSCVARRPHQVGRRRALTSSRRSTRSTSWSPTTGCDPEAKRLLAAARAASSCSPRRPQAVRQQRRRAVRAADDGDDPRRGTRAAYLARARRRAGDHLLRRHRAATVRRRARTGRTRATLSPADGVRALRYDALLDEWVAIAVAPADRTFLPPPDECPLCPSGRGQRADRDPGRRLRRRGLREPLPVVRHPAPTAAPAWSTASRCSRHGPACGRCEVVCFTSDHDASFAAPAPERVRTVVEAWVDRTDALAAIAGVEQVFCFENRGEEIGVTLHHPHGQIYAYPFVTPRTARHAARRRRRHRDAHRREPARRRARRRAGRTAPGSSRSSEHWTAFVPAPRAGRSRCTSPRTATCPTSPALDDAERDERRRVYLDLLRRLDRSLRRRTRPLPYIAAWHQAPVRDRARPGPAAPAAVLGAARPGQAEVPRRLRESAMGAFVNDALPEEIAARLRELG